MEVLFFFRRCVWGWRRFWVSGGEQILQADMLVFVTPLYYIGMSTQLKTVIDRFYSFNRALTEKRVKTALIVAAWDSKEWTIKDIQSHYETLCRYLDFQD